MTAGVLKYGQRLLAAAVFGWLPAGAVLAAAPSLEARVAALIAAYPETLSTAEDGKLLFKDGGPPLVIDDGRKRDHFERLATGDIADSLEQIYPAGACETRPVRNDDPGRIRNEALLKRLFGASAKAVAADLVKLDWFGESLRVTKRQGVNRALQAVRDDLTAAVQTDPALKRYLTPSSGTFNWRKVAGQPNLSVHSFGAAIDINTRFANYWVWSGGKPGKVPTYDNQYPMLIVDIFERHGFIWGGRWYHYDTMHFEYRPELMAIARQAGISACTP